MGRALKLGVLQVLGGLEYCLNYLIGFRGRFVKSYPIREPIYPIRAAPKVGQAFQPDWPVKRVHLPYAIFAESS
jgi:hypothetical protein